LVKVFWVVGTEYPYKFKLSSGMSLESGLGFKIFRDLLILSV